MGGSFVNCYKLPINVSGGLRHRFGSYSDWQTLIDSLIAEMILTDVDSGPNVNGRIQWQTPF